VLIAPLWRFDQGQALPDLPLGITGGDRQGSAPAGGAEPIGELQL